MIKKWPCILLGSGIMDEVRFVGRLFGLYA